MHLYKCSVGALVQTWLDYLYMKAILALSAALLLHVLENSDGFNSPPTVGACWLTRKQRLVRNR